MVVVLRKGFLILGTIIAIFGISNLLISRSISSALSDFLSAGYAQTLLGLTPGVIIVAAGAWMIYRALSRIVVPKDLRDMMGSNEKVQLYIKQTKFLPQPRGVDSWLLTNERVVKRHPHALQLKNSYEDHSYSEIKTLKFDQGILRSKVSCLLKAGPEEMETNVDVKTSEINKDKPRKTLEKRIKKFEGELEGKFDLNLLAKSDARKADGIIRENIVRFQTPFFQTPFPSDKIAYDSTQKTV
jgi:hypothetical protein